MPSPDPWSVLPLQSAWHFLGIELAVLAVSFAASFLKPWQRWVTGLERWLRFLSEKPAAAFLVIFCSGVLVRLLLLTVRGVPQPLFHDEFSYLLSADTFAHWRLTNPQPLFPQAFEAIHINLWPTYQSMYLPGTGLMLFVGTLLGSPWLTVLFGSALFCASVYWALAGWMERSYALAGALLAMGVVYSLDFWFDSYFCVGMLGAAGALVVGSIPRIARFRRLRETMLLGLGLGWLMLTRPLEAITLAAPLLIWLLLALRGQPPRMVARLAAGPLLLVLIAGGWLLDYNAHGTGRAMLSPYVVNFKQYHTVGPFLFSKQQALPTYRHESMRAFYTEYELERTLAYQEHPARFLLLKARSLYHAYVAGCGLLVLLGLVSLGRRGARQGAILAASFGCFALLVCLEAWYPFPHYAGPVAVLFFLFAAAGLRRLRGLRKGFFDGTLVSRGFVLAQVLLTASVVYGHVRHDVMGPNAWSTSVERVRVRHIVESHPGRHICFVRYGVDHPPEQEWIYNGADIPGQRLIWVRSLGAETDRRLLAAFPGRSAWLVDADAPLVRVVPYPQYGGQFRYAPSSR